ncbi:uncharacterized protein LODBEIA_P48830 [Lodderomyces beijingensis]|uniref:Complex III subunit 9 n=1 Tax=Lodderomyces beijingensis TaxID=1775926 RepID=A0ABP0ZR98_9ASCO
MASILGRILERNSIFVASIFAGAFAFQGFFDVAVNTWWNKHNHAKLWSTVKTKFVEGGEDGDDDDE